MGDDKDDIDIDRVIADPDYRRMVIRRLNQQARGAEPGRRKPPASRGGDRDKQAPKGEG